MKIQNFQLKLAATLAVFAFLAIGSSCTHPAENVESLPGLSFQNDVLPIFQTNCAMSGCHSGNNPADEYSCTDYASIMKKISPNSLSKSEAYQAIIDTWFEPMPPSPRKMLSQEQRTLIAVWILQGATETKFSQLRK